MLLISLTKLLCWCFLRPVTDQNLVYLLYYHRKFLVISGGRKTPLKKQTKQVAFISFKGGKKRSVQVSPD